VFVAYVRTVKTSSRATAVQIVHSSRKGSRKIEHLGSAHSDEEVAALKIAAAKRLAGDQDELDLGIELPVEVAAATSEPLPIVSSRMGHLCDALSRAYDVLGFDEAAGGDEVFRQLVLARIIEPTSKLDSLRVLEEAGLVPASYPTMNRRLRVHAKAGWRQQLAAACAKRAALGPASLVLYDVTTLYFETHEGDGFREPGFSKERRLEPQITVGLLTDAAGFPLMIQAFEGQAGAVPRLCGHPRAAPSRRPTATCRHHRGRSSCVAGPPGPPGRRRPPGDRRRPQRAPRHGPVLAAAHHRSSRLATPPSDRVGIPVRPRPGTDHTDRVPTR